ncbi:Xenotropic and polytropic retrovirus receptor 1, partial [Ascosphaera atra]
ELQDELVAEWQAKYFNYKQGKKKVKAIARALRTLENTSGQLQKFPFPNRTPSSSQNEGLNPSGSDEAPIPSRLRASTPLDGTRPVQGPVGPTLADTNLSRLPIGVPERTPLCSPRPGNRPSGSYGSIIASPPEESNMPIASLRLPDPVLTPDTSETAADQVSPRSQVGREDTEQEANGRHGGDEGAGTHALARSRSWWTPNLRDFDEAPDIHFALDF